MKVKELITTLQSMNQEALVVTSGDSEGNNYSPLSAAYDKHIYIAESTWSGEVHDMDDKEAWDDFADYEQEAILEEGVDCVVLCPVN